MHTWLLAIRVESYDKRTSNNKHNTILREPSLHIRDIQYRYWWSCKYWFRVYTGVKSRECARVTGTYIPRTQQTTVRGENKSNIQSVGEMYATLLLLLSAVGRESSRTCELHDKKTSIRVHAVVVIHASYGHNHQRFVSIHRINLQR